MLTYKSSKEEFEEVLKTLDLKQITRPPIMGTVEFWKQFEKHCPELFVELRKQNKND